MEIADISRVLSAFPDYYFVRHLSNNSDQSMSMHEEHHGPSTFTQLCQRIHLKYMFKRAGRHFCFSDILTSDHHPVSQPTRATYTCHGRETSLGWASRGGRSIEELLRHCGQAFSAASRHNGERKRGFRILAGNTRPGCGRLAADPPLRAGTRPSSLCSLARLGQAC